MGDPKLQAYLAQHYLSGPKADAILARTGDGQKKKRRKKDRTGLEASGSSGTGRGGGGGGLSMRDDEDSWKRADEAAEDGREAQVVKQEDRQRFKRNGWAQLDDNGFPLAALEPSTTQDQDEEDEQPQVVQDPSSSGSNGKTNSAAVDAGAGAGPSKPRAGLRTKEQIKAERLERERQQRAKEAEQPEEDATLAQTTVYRDERGRRIDVEAEDAERAREEQRRLRLEQEKKQWNRGERQRADEAARRAELEAIRDQGVARYASDVGMNAELRAREREQDPALAFLTKKRPSKGPEMPRYKGPPPPPNRFGIAPGYRWDGVDRGNGFEKRLFEAQGARARRRQEEHSYRTSDM
ncbi:unnamed protein product [Jaminaea pallidilutea]